MSTFSALSPDEKSTLQVYLGNLERHELGMKEFIPGNTETLDKRMEMMADTAKVITETVDALKELRNKSQRARTERVRKVMKFVDGTMKAQDLLVGAIEANKVERASKGLAIIAKKLEELRKEFPE